MNLRLAAALIAVLTPAAAMACLWDYDTLAMERSRFPSTLELITGKFLRHSPEFYEWRIRDRRAKLETEPDNLAYLDDLAVAYDKTGHDDKAIETILKKEQIKPGLYETYANLGTFYIHAGQLEKGLGYIDKAIAINPDAHFGREKYQKLLVEYLMSKRSGGKTTLPLAASDRPDAFSPTFVGFIRNDRKQWAAGEQIAAIKGVLGIMKFGKHDSPVVLEVLGDLLSVDQAGGGNPKQDAKLLAVRAYLKASYEVQDIAARKAYRGKADYLLSYQRNGGGGLQNLEQDFQQELAEADVWYNDLRAKEIAWIRDGLNPEAEFDKLYAQEPALSPSVGAHSKSTKSGVDQPTPNRFQIALVLGLLAVLPVFLAAASVIGRRKATKI